MWWSAPKIWPGETVFILASGPSAKTIDLSLLSGRRVIAVKSSWLLYPEADILFFADGRWWRDPALKPKGFKGLIVTTAQELPRVDGLMFMKKEQPKCLAEFPNAVALERTSTTGAINLAVHLGASRIVLLGVDGKLAADGTRHAHGIPWPWAKGAQPDSFASQVQEFRRIAPSAKKLGVEIINANPESAVDAFPKKPFLECL